MENIYWYAILGYVSICIIVGITGSERQIGFFNSFLLSMLTTPLIGFIITVVSSKKSQVQYKSDRFSGEFRKQIKEERDKASPDYISDLERLHQLKEKRIISQSEFELKKKEILGSPED